MLTADRSIDTVGQMEIWLDGCHFGDQELIPLLHPVEITRCESISHTAKSLAKCEVIGTIGNVMAVGGIN